MAVLRNGQRSLRRLRLRAFAEAAAGIADQLGPFSGIDAAWDLLERAESRAPDEVDDVVMYPSVGVWLSRALRQVLGIAPDSTPLLAEVGGFHALAAAAAYRSGLSFEIVVPVVHGAVTLPSVGSVRVPTVVPVGHVVLHHAPGDVKLTMLGRTAPVLVEPVKRHRSSARGRTVRLVFDDVDLYREFDAPRRATPLPEREFDEWRKLLDEAWDLLVESHPDSANELSAALSTVVPLDADEQVFAASSSAAFGSIAMSPKQSAVTFAEALVHETQHSKLNALLDFVALSEDDGECRFYAPWLDIPRPVTGLLHGIYAFCSVVEFWHLESGRVPEPQRRSAFFTTEYRRNQVLRVIDTLSRLPELTDLGREFVAAVSVRIAACPPSANVPEDISNAVGWITDGNRVVWRLRHVRPNEHRVTTLAEAWLAGRPADPRTGADVVSASPETGRVPLEVLLRARVLDQDQFARLGAFGDAETAFLEGDRELAAELFGARLAVAPRDVAAWAGLAVSSNSSGLRREPEVVRAVHHVIAVRTGTAPDPGQLAAWFDQAAS